MSLNVSESRAREGKRASYADLITRFSAYNVLLVLYIFVRNASWFLRFENDNRDCGRVCAVYNFTSIPDDGTFTYIPYYFTFQKVVISE